MRVTIVVSTLRAGGMERVAVNMANYWAAHAWQPTLVTTSQRGRKPAYDLHPGVAHRDTGWRRELRDYELDPAAMRAVAKAIDLSEQSHDWLLADFVLLTLLRQAIIDSSPGAIIAFGDLTNIRTIIASEGLGVPRLVSERYDPRRFNIGRWEPLRRKFYGRADGVVTLTRDAARYFEAFGHVCHVIPSVVLKPEPGPQRDEGPPSQRRRLVTLSRLVASKRIPLLIRSFAQVADRHPDWQLDIWGEGPDRPGLEQLVANLGEGDRVHLRGHTSDAHAALRGSDLFAMTSATEGFPNALCEAMACGVPPVVIDCGPGVRDIVRDGIDGVLVQGDDVGNFASVLDRLMSDGAERGRLAVRAPEVAERFAADKVMRQWEELIA